MALPITDDGTTRTFATGSVRDSRIGKGAFDLIPWDAIQLLAGHYESGADKYDDRNWEKGQNYSAMFDSMMRHAAQFWQLEPDDDEAFRHLRAVAWNALSLLAVAYRVRQGKLPKGLDDRPGRNDDD